MFCFTRPKYNWRDYNIVIAYLTLIPSGLAVLAFWKSKNVFFHSSMLYLTIFDEFLFRYMYFLYFPRTLENCIGSALLYSAYGYAIIPNLLSILNYFTLGFLFALASRRYSLIELCLFRYPINMYVMDLVATRIVGA